MLLTSSLARCSFCSATLMSACASSRSSCFCLRSSSASCGRRGAASLPDARKRLGGACGLGGGAFESSPAPGKRQEAAGGCRRSEIVLQQRRDVGRRSRRRAASWSSIDKRDSQRCSGTTCRRGGPGATARSGLLTSARGHRRSFLTWRRLRRESARRREKLRAPGLVCCGSFSTLCPTRRQRGRAVQASLRSVRFWTYSTRGSKFVARSVGEVGSSSRGFQQQRVLRQWACARISTWRAALISCST